MQENKSASPINKKNIFSQFVYQTNNKLRRGFKSDSFVETAHDAPEIGGHKDTSVQTTFRSKTRINENQKVEICKENFTQTSKTILALVQDMEMARLSPDSLSPKKEINEDEYLEDVEMASFSQSVSENQLETAPFNRKSDVEHDLGIERDKQNLQKNFLAGNSLTKAFLEQKLNKTKVSNIQRLFEQRKPVVQQDGVFLKSQSYIETPHTHMNSPSSLHSNQQPRFKVKNVTEKSLEDKTKPVRFFCPSFVPSKACVGEDEPSPSRSRKSTSFMSPTISSENKDQSREIKTLEKLISPTRRGRSVSPKKSHCEEARRAKKVPYIDKSQESVQASRTTKRIPFTENKEAVVAPPCTEAQSDNGANNSEKLADEGSELLLDLRLSCEDLTNNTAGGSVTSASSTESILYQALGKLRDQDWSIALRGLAEIVEICRVLDADFAYPHMTVINQRLIELMKSPRSHVCRTACQAVGHLFEYIKDTRRPEFDEIVDTLLCRTADANKFIRHDANLALDCMVTHIPVFHAVRALTTKGPDHKNPLVRVATARLLVCAVVIAGPQNILHPNGNDFTRKRIILNMVKFLDDKDMATRKFGERLYKLFHKDRIFEIYLKRYLERDVVVKIKKCMRSPNGEKF